MQCSHGIFRLFLPRRFAQIRITDGQTGALHLADYANAAHFAYFCVDKQPYYRHSRRQIERNNSQFRFQRTKNITAPNSRRTHGGQRRSQSARVKHRRAASFSRAAAEKQNRAGGSNQNECNYCGNSEKPVHPVKKSRRKKHRRNDCRHKKANRVACPAKRKNYAENTVPNSVFQCQHIFRRRKIFAGNVHALALCRKPRRTSAYCKKQSDSRKKGKDAPGCCRTCFYPRKRHQ